MPRRCIYRGCRNNSTACNGMCELLSFPADNNRARIWLTACGSQKSPSKLSVSAKVCSVHFVGGEGSTQEHPDPIPFELAEIKPNKNESPDGNHNSSGNRRKRKDVFIQRKSVKRKNLWCDLDHSYCKSYNLPELKEVLYTPSVKYDFSKAIEESRRTLLKQKELSGTPGVCIAVNINGKIVWTEGLGYADVENEVPCTPLSVMRIASISKSITMAVLARLSEDGFVDLDKPIQEYIPKFRVHSFDGEKVDITTRMLASHLSGIRHYKKKDSKKTQEDGKNKENEKTAEQAAQEKEEQDTEFQEIFMTKKFKSVEEALDIFKDDELFHKPGSAFLYTTYGWTVVSAVIEAAAKSTFPRIMSEFFDQMGLKNTYLDYNEPIVYHRARYYSRPKNGLLENARIVDNSYKWAGGGFMSTVGDLWKFGDIMLYCFQQSDQDKPGYLKAKTVEDLWSVKIVTPKSIRGHGYGMGWHVVPSRHEYGWGDKQKWVVYHTGAAVGASSVLLVVPRDTIGKPVRHRESASPSWETWIMSTGQRQLG